MVSGLVKVVVFDGRLDSPTNGRVNEFVVSEKNPGLLIVPPNLYHGWKNIGPTDAIIINMPDAMYDYLQNTKGFSERVGEHSKHRSWSEASSGRSHAREPFSVGR